MKENLYTPGCIRTYTGKYISPIDILPEQVDLIDIAHALSMQCRFGGHTKEFFSVAQHCVFVSRRFADKKLNLAGLLHDAAEAYIIDLPKPIKELLPDYNKMEERVMWAVAEHFGLSKSHFDAVKHADKEALEYEWENIVVTNTFAFRCWSPDEAFNDFINQFKFNYH